MKQITYTSYSQLGTPRIFMRELIADVKGTRELGWRLFITNLRSQVRQSWLGYIWLIVPPLITALIWIFLGRSKIINTNTADHIYPIFVISGIFIWQTFIEALNMPIQQLQAQKHVLTKVKAPHEAFILAGLGGIIFNFLIRMICVLVLLAVFQIGFHATLLLVPFGILSVLVLGLAIGLFFTPIGMLYSDIPNGLNAIASLMFFVTPIIYKIPTDTGIWRILKYNPVTPLLVTTRNWIINGIGVPENGFFIVLVLAGMILAASWIFYRVAKPHLIARLSS
ncbi:MAG: ABC transporter permease [Acidobacteria bacterium]|nr:ABC transporter permease [Acidobacteriota bacterium]